MYTGQITPGVNGNGFNVLNRTAPKRFFVPASKGMANVLLPNIPHERPTALNGEIASLQQVQPTFMNGYRNGVGGVDGYVAQPFFDKTIMVADVRDVMTQLEQSWETVRGNGTGYADKDIQLNPDLAYERLISITVDHCNINSVACNGFNIPSIATELAAKYRAWFNATFPKGWGDAYNYSSEVFAQKFPGASQSDYWMHPDGGTTTTPVIMPGTTPDPVPVTVPKTMNDQLKTLGGSGSNTNTNTNSGTGNTGGGGSNDDITKLLKDNWVILALAAGALVALPMLGNMGRR